MRILITAGPTREPIDPVRFISNRSSGRMGYALARQAVLRGHEVLLVAGPVALTPPEGVAQRVPVVTTREMLAAVLDLLPACNALIMAAAPADWRPREYSPEKLKKGNREMHLDLIPNPDILQAVRHLNPGRFFVGFAAESGDPVAEARRKLKGKHLDLIVANDISATDAGFEVSTNRVILIDRHLCLRLPLMDKHEVADKILDQLEASVAR